jgi:protein-L-isoaspartate O-methyltransferase
VTSVIWAGRVHQVLDHQHHRLGSQRLQYQAPFSSVAFTLKMEISIPERLPSALSDRGIRITQRQRCSAHGMRHCHRQENKMVRWDACESANIVSLTRVAPPQTKHDLKACPMAAA